MSFSSLFRRAQPLRKAAFSANLAQRGTRPNPNFRRFSTTPPPPPKSNTALYAGIGAAAVGGFAIYYLSDFGNDAKTAAKSASQSAKVAAGFVPTKGDYQKV